MDKSVDEVDNWPGGNEIVGIFAKEPVAGRVKTRLSPPLSGEQAAEFCRLALGETVANMANGGFPLALCFAGAEAYFRQTFPDIALLEQTGHDLGERMANALQSFFCRGFRKVVLIGSDSPDLPQALVAQAFEALDEVELVIAPALDGGYVLIGEAVHHPQLFSGIPWSSSDVLSLTKERAERSAISYRLLRGWEDLDDVASLQRFLRRSPGSRAATYLFSLAELEDVFAQP